MSIDEINRDPYLGDEEKSLNWENLAEKLQKEHPRTRYLPEYKSVKFIIFPDDAFLDYWNMLIIFLLLYTATVIPYRMILTGADDTSFIIWDTIVDGLYFIDTLLNCIIAYYNEDGILVTNKKLIFKRYMTSWMLIDLSSCIPIQLIFQTDKNYSKFIRIGRLPRLYRLIKMAKLIRIMKVFKTRSEMLKYISDICRVDSGVERLIWFLMTFMLMIHILACLWIFTGMYYLLDTTSNWITQSRLEDDGPFELYVTGLYWCVTTLATVGYGDIRPYNTTERLFTSGVMVIGIFIYSYIIGSLTNLLSNLDTRKAKLTKKLEILDNLTQEYGFNQAFYRKLTVALEYQHLNNKQELSDLLEDIPAHLRTQLLVLIYQKILESNAFFENKPSFFVTYVAPLLKPVRYDSDDFVYRQNDYAKEMYFIVKGEVVMLTPSPDGNTEISFNILSHSYYFGETDILFSEGKQRMCSVKCLGKCELLLFDHIDFENMLKKFEEESLEIMTLAHQRNQRLEMKKEDAIKHYLEKNEMRKLRSFPALNIPKHVKLADIISQSRANSIIGDQPKNSDEPPLSTRDDVLGIPKMLSVNPECTAIANDEDDMVTTKTLYNSVIEDKLVKEEDNLKIAKKKLSAIENTIQECLLVLKNITEFFDIDYEPGLLHFSTTFNYRDSLNI